MTLDRLVADCRAGDPLAWEAFVRRFQSRVYSMALHYMRDSEEARDVAQDVFVKLFRKLHRAPDGDPFVPWLLKLTRNHCVDALRRRARRPPATDLPADELWNLEGRGPSPHEAAEQAVERRRLSEALCGLSEQAREILLLKDVQGLKLEEIAALLGVPLGTVKSRAHRARLELAKALLALDPSLGAPQ